MQPAVKVLACHGNGEQPAPEDVHRLRQSAPELNDMDSYDVAKQVVASQIGRRTERICNRLGSGVGHRDKLIKAMAESVQPFLVASIVLRGVTLFQMAAR